MLVLRHETLDLRDGIGPDSKEGEEGDRAIVLG